jgi:hypothetical protein
VILAAAGASVGVAAGPQAASTRLNSTKTETRENNLLFIVSPPYEMCILIPAFLDLETSDQLTAILSPPFPDQVFRGPFRLPLTMKEWGLTTVDKTIGSNQVIITYLVGISKFYFSGASTCKSC